MIQKLPKLLHLTGGSFDTMIELPRPLSGDSKLFLGIADGATGFLHGGLLNIGRIAQARKSRAEKFLLTFLQSAGAETNLILPVVRAFVLKPDAIARDVMVYLVEDTPGLVAIDD